MKVNVLLPKGWTELSDRELRDVFRMLSKGYDGATTRMLLLAKWTGLRVLKVPSPDDPYYIVKFRRRVERDGERCSVSIRISQEEMMSMCEALRWVEETPDRPVRPSAVFGRRVRPAMCEGLIFEEFLVVDNRMLGWLHTHEAEHLRAICDVLMPPSLWSFVSRLFGMGRKMPGWLDVCALYWVTSLKAGLSRIYPHLFVKDSAEGDTKPMLGFGKLAPETVAANVDAQMRALTKGDITKEPAVRKMPYRRALAELEALARESENMKARMKIRK